MSSFTHVNKNGDRQLHSPGRTGDRSSTIAAVLSRSGCILDCVLVRETKIDRLKS